MPFPSLTWTECGFSASFDVSSKTKASGDSSVSGVLAVQAREPEFGSTDLSTRAQACNPSTKKAETGGSQACWLVSLAISELRVQQGTLFQTNEIESD